MLVDRQSIEAGERLVHADEAQLPVAESQTDGDIPDRVQEAPGRVLRRRAHGRQFALTGRLHGYSEAGGTSDSRASAATTRRIRITPDGSSTLGTRVATSNACR